MNRSSAKFEPRSSGCKMSLLAVGLAMLLSACGEGPGDPKPPLAPPRPITEAGPVSDWMAWTLRSCSEQGFLMALSIQHEQVRIKVDDTEIEGMLFLPANLTGVIMFAHDSGGSRIKPPNDYVASVLRDARLGTLWLELLSEQEAWHHPARNDATLLARRLDAACDWVRRHRITCGLPIGLFGSGYGAAAALQVAAARGRDISAIVSRGGQPDPAARTTFMKVTAPTLLIVGSLDDGVINLNRSAYAGLRCKKRLEIIPGATHAFDEPGSLEVVARLTRGWFLQHAHFALV